jgi:hypothetical protein
MLTADQARDLVQAAIGAAWTPGTATQPGHLDMMRFWTEFLGRLDAHLQVDPPDGLNVRGQVEPTLALAGVMFLCWSFWILQSKGIWHGPGPHHEWRALLDWMRRSLDDLLRDARNLGADEKRDEQKTGSLPTHVAIPGPFADWREPV